MIGKIKVAAAVAGSAVLLFAGAGVAQAGTHPGAHKDATPACGFSCSNLFSEQLGHHAIESAFVPGSNGLAINASVGTKLDLKTGNDAYTNQDFVLSQDDTLADACQPVGVGGGAGLLSPSSYSCIQLREGNFDGSFPVIEDNWAPDGNASSLCTGVAVAHQAGELVTLQSCGEGANTLWVIDENDVHPVGGTIYAPAILGSDSLTSQPLVLQVNTGSKNPANVLQVNRLSLLSHGFVPNQDMWSFLNGPAL